MPTKQNKKYVAKATGRTWNTREEAIKDNARYKNDVSYRYSIKGSRYKSPFIDYNIPFIEDKAITLSNAGVATGAILSTNLLDSIAVNAERAGLPLKTAIGLATKESTLNNQTFSADDRAKISSIDRGLIATAKLNGYYHPEIFQNKGNKDIFESDLINFNSDDNPYMSTMLYLNPPPRSITKSKVSTQEEFNKKLEESEAYDDRRASKNESYPLKSYLQAGFEHYKRNPKGYNPGQPNYSQLVDKRGEEVWGSPEVQNWYKGYRRRLESSGKLTK